VQDHCAVMFRDGCSEQVNDPCCPVMAAGRHPDLDIAGAISDRRTDWQDNIEFFAAAGDPSDIG
jgi:hypothetical protein